ncbi:nuclear apoptosis-inducing factor 1-like [Saccostrea cucullata]
MEERKANWSEVAIETLVDLVTDSERWAVIRGKFSPALTIHTKQKVWIDITERVNASSTCIRAVKDVKKKWQDIQSHTKKKEANRKAELRKTGGGPPPPELKNWEKKIVSILSEDVISGVDGGGG